MAEVHLPATLPPLFRDLPRRVEVEAPTVASAIAELDARWPGLRDRLCVPRAPSCGRTSTSTSTRSAPGSRPRSRAGSRVDVIAAISGG